MASHIDQQIVLSGQPSFVEDKFPVVAHQEIGDSFGS